MSKATISGGQLLNLTDCYITIPGSGGNSTVLLNNLPDISDSKSASYNDEPIMGRSFPLKTFSHSENRSISMTLHFIAVSQNDLTTNLGYLRAIESCVYPRTQSSGFPFQPPPICQIKCGKLLGEKELCVVLKQYSVKFPVDVPWDDTTYVPWKFDVETTWDVVYASANLPGQENIIQLGM